MSSTSMIWLLRSLSDSDDHDSRLASLTTSGIVSTAGRFLDVLAKFTAEFIMPFELVKELRLKVVFKFAFSNETIESLFSSLVSTVSV